MERRVETGHFATFRQWLLEEEREPATIEKYLREVELFATWMESQPVTKEQVVRWKAYLTTCGFQPGTVNGKLSALNKFFSFLGWSDCRTKYLRIQRRVFRNIDRELTKEEYLRLLETAQDGVGAAGLAYRGNLRHRDTGKRGEIHNCGNCSSWTDRNLVEGKDKDHPPAGETVPKAGKIRQKNRL